MTDEYNDIKEMQEVVAEFLSGGGNMTRVPPGVEALTKGGKKRKKSRTRKAKPSCETAPTTTELAPGQTAPVMSFESEPEDIVPDIPVDIGIAERPFAAIIESYDDDQPRRRGFYRQQEIAIGKGKQKVVITTALGEHIADSEPDGLLPGVYKRLCDEHPLKREHDKEIRRRERADAALEKVMAQTKVGADDLGIRTLKRNTEIVEYRGKDHFDAQTIANLGIPQPPSTAPTRGYKRPRGRSHHTPKGSTDFRVDKVVRRTPARAKMTLEQSRLKEIANLKQSRLKEIAIEICALGKGSRNRVRIGRLLLTAKELLDHGEFQPWVQSLGIHVRTAARYVKAVPQPNKAPNRGGKLWR